MRTASSTASCAAGVWANTAVVTSKRVNRVRIAVLDARGTDLVVGPRGSRRSICRVNTLFVAVKLPVHSGRIVGNPSLPGLWKVSPFFIPYVLKGSDTLTTCKNHHQLYLRIGLPRR